MSTEAEIVDLAADGRSVIDVRGSDFDSALLVDGQPIALIWSDCEGSIAQYMARAGTADCEDQLRALRFVLALFVRRSSSLAPRTMHPLPLCLASYRLCHRGDYRGQSC